jgi:hypothetical protein
VKHGLSEQEKAWRSRPFGHTGRFWGSALVACVVVPYSFWHMGVRATLLFIPYLIAAAGIGSLVILVRRVLRPPQAYLDQTFIEVTSGGIWRTAPIARFVILAAPQIQQVHVFRSRFKEIVRIEIGSESKTAQFEGLSDMQAFLDDVRSTFARCRVQESEVGVSSSPP